MARRRLEADERLGLGARADLADEVPELREPAGVARGLHLVEEPDRGEFGIGGEPLLDERLVGIEFRPARGVADRGRVEVAIEFALGEPAIEGAATQAHARRDGGLREALLEVVSE